MAGEQRRPIGPKVSDRRLGMYASFFGQLEDMQAGAVDPAPVSSAAVAVIKGIGFVLAIVGLITSLGKVEEVKS